MILIPLMGEIVSLGVIKGVCGPIGTLSSLFADEWGCVPPLVCCLAWDFSALMVKADFSKVTTSSGVHTNQYTQDLCLQCPFLTMSHSHCLFSQEILQDLHVGLTQLFIESLLFPGTQCKRKPECTLLELNLFPPVLWSSCAQALLAFNARCSRVAYSQCYTPSCEKLTWGSELSLLW